MAWTLVTGGAGFIGLCIVERLLAEGTDVVVFDARAVPPRALREFRACRGRLRSVEGDIRSPASLAAAFREPVEEIVHAAAITAGRSREASEADRVVGVNVNGTVNVAMAAAAHAVKRVLLVSSAAVYGAPEPAMVELDEDSAKQPYTLYASTKYVAELLLRRLADVHGFHLRIARLGWVFGPWEHASGVRDTMSSIYQATMAATAGTPFVLPRADRREWSYSRDVAGALAALLRAPMPRWPIYNLNAGIRLDLSDWALWLREVAGPPSEGAPQTIDLHGETDGLPLRARRFGEEFEMAWRSPREAFRDYTDWLRSDPWPARQTKG